MPEKADDEQVEQEKQDQVLHREGLEEHLMQQDRSGEAAAIDDADSGEEPR